MWRKDFHESRIATPADAIFLSTEKGTKIALSPLSEIDSGDALLSQAVAHQVPSALAVLTSVFGMGTGVTLPPWSPETFESQVIPDNSIASTNRHL